RAVRHHQHLPGGPPPRAGCYVLETDVSGRVLAAGEVDRCYRGLAAVERAIRRLRTGGWEIGPVSLRRADRTRGHALVRLPGLKLQLALEGRLRAAFGTTDTDAHTVILDDALTALGRLCLERYQVEGRITVRRVRRLTHPDERQQEILEALGVTPPTFKTPQATGSPRRRCRPQRTVRWFALSHSPSTTCPNSMPLALRKINPTSICRPAGRCPQREWGDVAGSGSFQIQPSVAIFGKEFQGALKVGERLLLLAQVTQRYAEIVQSLGSQPQGACEPQRGSSPEGVALEEQKRSPLEGSAPRLVGFALPPWGNGLQAIQCLQGISPFAAEGEEFDQHPQPLSRLESTALQSCLDLLGMVFRQCQGTHAPLVVEVSREAREVSVNAVERRPHKRDAGLLHEGSEEEVVILGTLQSTIVAQPLSEVGAEGGYSHRREEIASKATDEIAGGAKLRGEGKAAERPAARAVEKVRLVKGKHGVVRFESLDE
ncbi:MAG TPA: hypothetical protein P5568_02745, partial [Acidobacteriota bacterium]|nr:hypothetical protein [Acidobacteriota bacterium]